MTERVVDLLHELIAINSVNPAYPGGVAEAAIAAYVDRHCRGMGLIVTRQEVSPGRDNILATLSVPGAQRTLLYEAHMDTVALEPMGEDGLQPATTNGRVYGRGACDTKGSLAAMLVAIANLREQQSELACNVAILAAVDEEHAFTGILTFINSGAPVAAAGGGEPTELRIVIAHKGCIRGTIHTHGRAAHSAEPDRGVNAIDGMADVLVGLRELQRTHAGLDHPLLGGPTFSVGLVEGGTGVNIVPEQCTMAYDRRTLPGETPEQALAEIDAVLDEVRASRPAITITRPEPALISESLDTEPDSELVRSARAACRATGLDDSPAGVPYGTDASTLQHRRNVPAIVFGPGSISQAHGADEFVPVDHLTRAVDFYESIALGYQGE